MSAIAEFDLRALYAALDAERQARSLSWAQATREISRQPAGSTRTGMSTSTITGIRARTNVEADGVLQMLQWLGRSPESFVPGHPLAQAQTACLPQVAADRVLRFDTKAIHDAIDAERTRRNLSWVEVAKEMCVPASSLTYLARGSRTSFPQVMRIVRWLGRPAACFTWAASRRP